MESVIELQEVDGRFVHGKLHYRGDVRNMEMKRMFGPDTNGQMWWPLKVEYDEKSKRSTVYFSLTPPDEYLAMVEAAANRG